MTLCTVSEKDACRQDFSASVFYAVPTDARLDNPFVKRERAF